MSGPAKTRLGGYIAGGAMILGGAILLIVAKIAGAEGWL